MAPRIWLVALIVLITGVLISACSTGAPAPPPDSPTGWQRVHIADVGSIDIPGSMEVQGGVYKELKEAFNKQVIPEIEAPVAGQVIIQQRGLNALDPDAFNSYVRLIVETELGTPGTFATLGTRFDATAEELREISVSFRTQAESPAIKILQWDVPSVELVNGMQAIRLSYRRQVNDKPPARVTVYVFQNHDRIHRLTMSYRETERSTWLADFPAILSSFRITNVRRR